MNPLSQALRVTRGLRFRLALSYVVFFSILIVVLGLLFRQTLSTIFQTQVSDTLKEEFGAFKSYLRTTDSGPDFFYDQNDPDESYTVEQLRRVYLLTDPQGHPLQWSTIYKSIGFDSPAEIDTILKSNKPAVRIGKDAQGTSYMLWSGLMVDERHNRYYLAIGRSIANNQRVLRDFTRNYFSLVPIVIVLSGLLGWFMAGRALDPLNSVSETAQRITHSNLDMQIPLRGAGDELDRLIEAFNRMMTRLNFSFEQIRQFSTDVSHELRTPLTVVRGQLEVALFTAKTPEQYREAMVNALEDVERLSNIVRALLMLSQAESGQLALQRTELNFADLIRDLVDEYQIPAEAQGVSLAADLPKTCFLVADRIQIERLVSNLLSNAIKYTPQGGKVRVRLWGEGSLVKFSVEDTGVGIATDHLPQIFDRFYRVPSADPEKGLGLGLSFVAWIVKAHGGTVDVTSKPNQGTCFTVSLPSGQSSPSTVETPALSPSEQLH
jgi:heavy metal sensor kinase